MRLAGLLALALAVPLGACGSGDDEELSAGPVDDEVAGLVAPSLPQTYYVDVAGIREQLGLSADQPLGPTPAAPESAPPSIERLTFTNVTSRLLVFAPRPRPDPAADAIDSGEVSAGATGSVVSTDAVATVVNSQPFDEIADSLEHHGYRRSGDVLADRSPVPPQPFFPAVADGGEGVLILAGSREAAKRALSDRGAEQGEPAALLDSVGGVARRAIVTTPPRDCVVSVAIGQDYEPGRGEIVVTVDGEASADGFVLDDVAGTGDAIALPPVEFGTVEAEGGEVRAEFSFDLDENQGSPAGLIDYDHASIEIYRC